ncbi:MAG: FAD-dependent monooxygenase [Candidatus Wallbacteria bacterium]|nr:FAD-dependent monooxygenase [Candidatus Wallbacteria bacterium]
MPRVIVVGAGPAGLASAIFLARAGVEVLVLEGAPGLRARPGGEGMMPPGVAQLAELGVLEAVRARGASAFQGIAYFDGGRELARADFPAPPAVAGGLRADGAAGDAGLGVRRPGLEAALLGRLSGLGSAEVRFGCAVQGLVWRGGRVAGVALRDRRELADAVLGADGLKSTVRRMIGAESRPRRAGARFGVCGHFEWESSRPQMTHVQVHLVEGGELYRTPCGAGVEGWIFLSREEVVRGWVSRGGPGLSAGFEAHARSVPELARALEGARPLGRVGAIGPLQAPATRRWAPGVLLVGDAAGFLDALTGEGLALGLTTARAAVELLLESGLRVGFSEGHRYERAWRDATRQPWALTRALLFLTARRWLALQALGRLGRHPDAMRRLLGINCGYGGLGRFLAADLPRLILG